MHILSKKTLRAFWVRYPDSEMPLRRWHTLMKREHFMNFQQLRALFPSADWVKGLVVFNIGGNKYRLIADVRFEMGRVYLRSILTHKDYDKGDWNE